MPDILTFKGNLVDTIDHDHIYGPDRDRRYLVAKTVRYDVATDTTKVALRGLVGDELNERVAPLVKLQSERQRIRELFNG